MARILFFITVLCTAVVYSTVAQQVSGYSQGVSLNIQKQGEVIGYSGQTNLNISSASSSVDGFSGQTPIHLSGIEQGISGMSPMVNIDIPQSVIHQLPDNFPPVPSIMADVDQNIPQTDINSPNTLALIIGNEDYESHQTGLEAEVNVDYANRDAAIFKEYLVKTLGVPYKNIQLLTDAGLVDMKRAITKTKLLIKAMRGEANVIVYYAGHGLPHDKTKEPYIIPVDIGANDLSMSIKLAELYKELTEFPSRKVIVLLDACFSGGAREQGLLAARGVKIKPKEQPAQGKLVVFAATSGSQSALPYREKNHGMFTYHLLKSLQINKGEINLGDLSEYLIKEVSVHSLLVNSREQTPKVNKSSDLSDEWFGWMLY